MEKENSDLSLILWAISIIFAILLWYFTKNELLSLFNKYRPWKKKQTTKIVDLENSYLIIENKELLNDKNVSNKYKYVFWPVTPTDSPNLIHLLSIYYLNKLSEFGLRIIVFEFDSYYELIKNINPKTAEQKLRKFEQDLKKMGLKNCWYRIESESDYINNKSCSDENFAKRFYIYMSSLKFGELLKLKKEYVESNTPSIRFFKPILNMLYLNLVPYKIGYTFSGIDEKLLWDTFSKSTIDGKKTRLTNFYIPSLPKLLVGQTNVLDKTGNITIDDSENDIFYKISTNEQSLSNGGLIRIILEIFLKTGETIEVLINENNLRKYTSYSQISEDLNNKELKEKIIKSISHKIHDLFNQ